MVQKSLLVALLLLGVYTWFTVIYRDAFEKGQHQWQDNLIRAQNYLYADTIPKAVILGSSMACRINDKLLPNHFYKLAFGGQGVLDGLSIIMQRATLPKKVLVEMNMIQRAPNADFAGTLFAPGLFTIRQYVPALQDRYQPGNLLLATNAVPLLGTCIYEPIAAKTLNWVLPKLFSRTINESANRMESKMIAEQVKQYSNPVDSTVMRSTFHELKTQVQKLNQQGVQVIFFEMPMAHELEYSVKQKQIRAVFKQYFPPTEFLYLTKPDYKNYSTTDGVHLTRDAADDYTRSLLSSLGN